MFNLSPQLLNRMESQFQYRGTKDNCNKIAWRNIFLGLIPRWSTYSPQFNHQIGCFKVAARIPSYPHTLTALLSDDSITLLALLQCEFWAIWTTACVLQRCMVLLCPWIMQFNDGWCRCVALVGTTRHSQNLNTQPFCRIESFDTSLNNSSGGRPVHCFLKILSLLIVYGPSYPFVSSSSYSGHCNYTRGR